MWTEMLQQHFLLFHMKRNDRVRTLIHSDQVSPETVTIQFVFDSLASSNLLFAINFLFCFPTKEGKLLSNCILFRRKQQNDWKLWRILSIENSMQYIHWIWVQFNKSFLSVESQNIKAKFIRNKNYSLESNYQLFSFLLKSINDYEESLLFVKSDDVINGAISRDYEIFTLVCLLVNLRYCDKRTSSQCMSIFYAFDDHLLTSILWKMVEMRILLVSINSGWLFSFC